MTHPTITKALAVQLSREAGIEFQEHEGITGKISCTTRGSQPVVRIQALAKAIYKLGRNAGLEAAKHACMKQADPYDAIYAQMIESLKDNTL